MTADLVVEHTIHAAVVGSRAFGLSTEASDTDVRGVFLAPSDRFWGLAKPPTHLDGPDPEWFSWELERFCVLALKATPNCLEVLWSPLVVRTSPVGEELIALRRAFLSREVHATFVGYAASQFRKLENTLARTGAPKWKHAMHLLRLQRAALTLLEEGDFVLDVGPDRDRLLAVKAGEVPWEKVDAWRAADAARLTSAADRSPLPAEPDTAAVDTWLRSVRSRSAREVLGL